MDASMYLFLCDPLLPNEKEIDMPIEWNLRVTNPYDIFRTLSQLRIW
jgi:hypothetical protein